MPTTDTRTDLELTIAVAQKVMGWQVRIAGEPSPTERRYPALLITADGPVKLHDPMYRDPWNPADDPRAWWEIVEHLRSKGLYFTFEEEGDHSISVHFAHNHKYIRGAATDTVIGRAVLLAALVTVEE
jgi:hypothetical protein